MVLIAPKTTHSRIANKHRKHQAFRTGTDRRKTWCLFGVLIGKTRGYEPIRCTVSDTTIPHEMGIFQRYSTMPLSRIRARGGKRLDSNDKYYLSDHFLGIFLIVFRLYSRGIFKN